MPLPVSSANAAGGQHLFDVPPSVEDTDDSYDRGVDSEEDAVGTHDQLSEIPHPDPFQLGHDAAALGESRQCADLRDDARADLHSRAGTRFDGEVVEDTLEIVDGNRRPANPASGRRGWAKLLDLEMLVLTPRGRERLAKEFAELMSRGGFRLTRVVPTLSPVSVLEAERH